MSSIEARLARLEDEGEEEDERTLGDLLAAAVPEKYTAPPPPRPRGRDDPLELLLEAARTAPRAPEQSPEAGGAWSMPPPTQPPPAGEPS